MSDKLFSIYRSSAGSGKTRTLAREYLKLALRYRADYYKHILAVTFTNKATQEMKDRILHYLNEFAQGRNDSLANELMVSLDLDPQSFQLRCQELQAEILHHYSQFAISTIDSFFQKIIRAFTREAGLAGDYRLEINQEEVIEEVVDKLVDELGSNEQLTKWVIEFAKENLENDRSWDVRSNLTDFTFEIFREEFRSIEDEVQRATANPEYIPDLQRALRKSSYGLITYVKKHAKDALAIIHANGWSAEDFKWSGGVYNLFLKLSKITAVKELDDENIGKRARKEFQEASHWPDKKTPQASSIEVAAEQQLIPILNQLLDYRDKHFVEAISAEVVLNNFYAFGLITDLSRKLREYKEENNIMLLADAPKFLHGIIQDSDTPFIYEKVGSFFRNYLIDEFQDTSGMQWNNFKPLLINSLDQGYPGFVVGDVKQSIYRWRGGDLKLLQQEVEQHVGSHRVQVKELSSNYRSAANVVDFNNAVFESIVASAASHMNAPLIFESYKDVAQKISKSEEGYVKIQFFIESDRSESWKEEALAAIPKQLEVLQDNGVALRDIAILVRNNREGVEIAEYLMQYKNTVNSSTYSYDIISNESLRMDSSVVVNVLVSALQYMVNPEDLIARAQLSLDYAKLSGKGEAVHETFTVTDKEIFKTKLPISFIKEHQHLKKLPLFEITETIIELFQLGDAQGELLYLQCFQNLVLDFSSRERNDIHAFLQWWEDNKAKKSIQVSGAVDASQIISIHKSKGLQFPYVIIPFCSWETDHVTQKAPNLWVKTKEEPFQGSSFFPVRYSSVLENTYFKEAYEEEKTRVFLDNLNLLYVAFTRAERGLVVYAPDPSNARMNKTVAKILLEGIRQSDELSTAFDQASFSWEKGKVEVIRPKEQVEEERKIALQRYKVGRWRKRMVLNKKSSNLFRNEKHADEEQRRRGVLLHAIFSRIRYAADCDAVLEQARNEGLIAVHEFEFVQQQFKQLLSNALIASWFALPWEVRTEAPILSPDKPDVRVDRIMIQGNTAIVLDYKTGVPHMRDEEQVAAYMRILREMNFTQVEGYLLYLQSGELKQVAEGKQTKSGKKDTRQLGLEL